MIMKNGTYDVLKRVALVYAPALVTLILALGKIWSWQYATPVAGTVAALATFLGACLGVSSERYWAAQSSQEDDTDGVPADRD